MPEYSAKQPSQMEPAHPGSILREDVLPALNLTVAEAARGCGYTPYMDSGLIILLDGTLVAVHFRLRRDGQSGTVSAKQARDFDTLLRLFDGDDTVILQNVRGTWKAHVHIWEPDTLADPRLASFEFTVEEQIEGKPL